MFSLTTAEIALLSVAGLLSLLVAFRPEFTRARGGKIVAFVALFILPLVASWAGLSAQMEKSKETQFCLSCHVMTDYGRSLYNDDKSYIPAAHFQNKRIPREQACYTCHTTYTLYGPLQSKLRGLRHIYVQYLGTVPKPEAIKLYTPYNNRECLHCHLGARSFEEASAHRKDPSLLGKVKSGKLSCMSSSCHEFVHDVGDLKDATFWKETP